MKPDSVYAVSAYSVRLAVMSVLMVAAALPKGSVVTIASPDAGLFNDPLFVNT